MKEQSSDLLKFVKVHKSINRILLAANIISLIALGISLYTLLR